MSCCTAQPAQAHNGSRPSTCCARATRVITPDLPGYGGSQVDPNQPANSLDADAQAVIELIDMIGEPVHLVGHSFGAAVAAKVAMNAGDRVRSLTLFEPSLFHLLRDGATRDQALFSDIAQVETMMAACAQDDDAHEGMARFIEYWNGEGTWRRLTDNVRDMYASEIGHVLRDFAAGRNETWALSDAARITCPTSVYFGLASSPVTQRTSEMMAEAIPDASLTMVADADHMMPMTHADILAPDMKDRFASVELMEERLVEFDQRCAA